MQMITIELSNAANIGHPFAEYTLADAVRLANDNRSLNMLPPVISLSEAREVIQSLHKRAGCNWITGMAALDVLDAAIENRDLKQSCRLI